MSSLLGICVMLHAAEVVGVSCGVDLIGVEVVFITEVGEEVVFVTVGGVDDIDI